ncbi:putative AlkP superfamily pyrophosphatase or phosphodiesterase [Sphingomonas jinjuensis]|uniref:Putative AlkP superfamily pyrophosphatase or phosphodiesterase n=1 Tax=Sphingomonas jinjuensis TaxID=535907 RepID=A0A840FG30_9SPHN|nr:ectonucleotide pyrophosphatase/phosphodiesterase [Sphingomonas jinjuensis]MBB4154597.1 putative AlkP superfamily pyrophosphatase or phosphodiesterase [Sphingomonas jinjuensis]
MRRTLASLLLISLSGCAYSFTPPVLAPATQPSGAATGAALPVPTTPRPNLDPRVTTTTMASDAPVTILVSIDGFRPDYLDRGVTPRLSALKSGGVSAAMRPSFPSLTFPNHWTLVTGLRPDRSGMVGNTFEDPRRPGQPFAKASDDPFWWSESEPLWATAERAGIRSASMLWPGSNAPWGTVEKGDHGLWMGGIRPQDWQQYNANLSATQRVETVLDWMRRPAATRPRFVTLYFDSIDMAGHDVGPNDPRITQAVGAIDRSIGTLVDGLRTLGIRANLVIVSDHGMAATSSSRSIPLDGLMPKAAFRTTEVGALGAIYPQPGQDAIVAAALLKKHDHMQCWRREAIPARFHYGRNPRVAPYICLADTGWRITPTPPPAPREGGDHGFDPSDPAMRALFIANGPAFQPGRQLPVFDNVDVAPLMRDLLGLPAGNGLDGTDAPFRKVMR